MICLSLMLIFIAFTWLVQSSAFSQKHTDEFNLEYAYNINSNTNDVSIAALSTFQKAKLNTIPAGFGDHNQWIKLSFSNPKNIESSLRLLFDNPLIDRLTIYQLVDSKYTKIDLMGDLVNEDYDLDKRILPNIPFILEPNETVNLMIQIQTNGVPISAINLMYESVYLSYTQNLHIIWGAFIGIIMVMASYNAVLYLGLKDSTYLNYVLYLIASLAMIGLIHGFGYYYLPKSVQLFLSHNVALTQTFIAITAIQFGASFLNISKHSGKAYKFKEFLIYTLLVFGVCSLFLSEAVASPIFGALQTLTYVCVTLMVCYRINSRISWSKYYIISWFPFFIGAAISMLLFVGFIEYSYYTRHALLFSIMLEMSLISTALADRMGELEKRRFYHATHDFKTNLPNDFYIKQYLSNLNRLKKTEKNFISLHSVICAKITNFDLVFPYLSTDQQKRLLVVLNENFKNTIEKLANIISIDKNLSSQSIIFNHNQFLLVISSKDQNQLINILKTISEVENFNPLPDEIPYRIECIFSARMLDDFEILPEEIINDTQQCLNYIEARNLKYQIFHKNMIDQSQRSIRLARDLEVAINENGLELYHQPQLDLNEQNQAEFSEVLIRWNHKELGFIPPDEFILIAEQTGIIQKVTMWVVEQSFIHHLKIFDTHNIRPIISINISANDFSREGFCDQVETLIHIHKIEPKYFTLEITETSAGQDTKVFLHNIEALKKLGFQLAIDDFGTGYSSLTYISNLPFDELKIDRSFIKDLVTSERQYKIVDATIQMASKLGLCVTAEGIEDEKTLLKLIELNCNKIQGYYYAKPMGLSDYMYWLKLDQQRLCTLKYAQPALNPKDNNQPFGPNTQIN